jgi:ribosomal protein L35
MPKLKSKRGVKKRFKVSATGKVKAARANRRHILTNKSPKSKRKARRGKWLTKSDNERMLKALLAN